MSLPKPLLCLGIVTWDMLFKLDEIPTKGIKVPAKDCVEVGGGMSASAAVAISRLGGKVHFWGRCGDDATGDRIADDLRAEGVDVSNLRRVAGKRSPVSAILIDRHGPVIIDLPQAVDAAGNHSAQAMQERDVQNLATFFANTAPQLAHTQYGKEIWNLYQAGLLQADTPLTRVRQLRA